MFATAGVYSSPSDPLFGLMEGQWSPSGPVTGVKPPLKNCGYMGPFSHSMTKLKLQIFT